MSIKKANKLLENNDFENALIYYESILQKHPSLRNVLQYNIQRCELALGRKEKSFKSQGNRNLKQSSLLSVDLSKYIQNRMLPSYKDIAALMTSLKSNNVNIDSILRCGCSSPFQIELLKQIRRVLVSKKLKNKIYKADFGLNLATLIKLATDKEYWLVNKVKFKKQYKNICAIDKRLDALLENFSGVVTTINKFNFDNVIRKESSNSIVNDKSIAFGTILLNEQKFIAKSLFHHYNFCNKWVLVEGTCLGYPERKVTASGFSKDLSSTMIKIFPDPEDKIIYVPHGWTVHDEEDAKSELRNRYLRYIDEDYLVVVDADEFYLKKDLVDAFNEFKDENVYGITLPQVHFWKSTEQYITGEYYDISHTRLYRNIIGMKYIRNHNFPEIRGKYIHEMGHLKFKRTQVEQSKGYIIKEPKCLHMGFAKDYDDMKDKSDYYVNRGEDKTRKTTTASRAAWFNDKLPEKCRVKKYSGELPDVLKEVEK